MKITLRKVNVFVKNYSIKALSCSCSCSCTGDKYIGTAGIMHSNQSMNSKKRKK